MAPPLAAVSIDDKYALESGRIFVTGTQALVRLPLLQHARDRATGINTAGFITGYQGSPLGGYDRQLWRAQDFLEKANIRFEPGVNEDLAATAVWGSQQLNLIPSPKFEGVFSIWYGKGPGVDRSGDPFKHGNRAGTSAKGGVLIVFGDDHPAKSSTVAFQSEPALAANGIPVLYPANVQELLDFGIHGWAMSRFSGCWIGFKTINETVEGTASVDVAPERVAIALPEGAVTPVGGVHIRTSFDPVAQEALLYDYKLPLAQAYARANGLNRVSIAAPERRLGIVTAGKTYLDVRQALTSLGIDDARARSLGISLYKVGLVWPLEPHGMSAFASGHEELLFIEEKQPLVQDQAAALLYNMKDDQRPRIVGKTDERDEFLLPAHSWLETVQIARVIGARLNALRITDSSLTSRLELLQKSEEDLADYAKGPTARLPYFCSGCPHNTSTKVPEGSMAMSGIGCHAMAMWMDRDTTPPTHMGGEGVNWTGIAPFSNTRHMFQNLGDGTYYHSGLLAIRAAVKSKVNITYKILVNDAVAMTGGQPVLGDYSVRDIAAQVIAEGANEVCVVTDDTVRYDGQRFGSGITLHHRDDMDSLQRRLRETDGVTVIVYEQTCAAEKRRRRKRNAFPDPPKRVFINDLVCEGCGDCSVQANCVSILPKETEFGRKREIDQSNCNKDYSCVKGFCPSFVTVHGGGLRKPPVADIPESTFASLVEPVLPEVGDGFDVIVTGIGGTGVVTIGAVLGMAAHLERKGTSVYDVTGLAQKNGAVFSHLRFAANPSDIFTPKIGMGETKLLLACDMVAAASPDVIRSLAKDSSTAIINSYLAPTASFQLNRNVDFRKEEILDVLQNSVGSKRCHSLDATGLAKSLLGNTIGSNMMMVGSAYQAGSLPLSANAIERAIELNGVSVAFNTSAFRLGRLAVHDLTAIQALLPAEIKQLPPEDTSLKQIVERRAEFLVAYQDATYADRYTQLIDKVVQAESEKTKGSSGLAMAVARNYFRLLAYKDEYEVARLYTDPSFANKLDSEFEGSYQLKFHLAPPILCRPNKQTGIANKMEFGGWMMSLFKVIARFKGVRGTMFDPFGYTTERRMERQLIGDYETVVAEIISKLDSHNHPAAVALAEAPAEIKGYGHVKAANAERVKACEAELLNAFRHPEDQTAAA